MTTPADDRAKTILARFPGPVTIYPSRRKWLLLFGGCALFAAGGVMMVQSGERMGWLVLGFFGLCAFIPLVMMLPGSARLVLDRDGFEYRTLFKSRRSLWRNTGNFGWANIPPGNVKLVVFDDVSASGMSADLNAGITGRNSALSDTYGFAAADLADLLEAWRARAVTPSGTR
jgi:hypothetical protein